MDDKLNLLITLTDGVNVIRVALQVGPGILTGDAGTYWLEPENKEQFFKLLPLHCQSFGKIVDVEDIFETVVAKKSN